MYSPLSHSNKLRITEFETFIATACKAKFIGEMLTLLVFVRAERKSNLVFLDCLNMTVSCIVDLLITCLILLMYY